MQPTNTSLERPLSDDPLSSFTIPARWYLDEEIYAQEKNAIFYREWHYIGHVSTLTTPGDYSTMQLADENIFVIRDDDDQLRGFYNVCRHRAHQLVSGNGRVKDIVCPYHAWRYNKSGELCFARNTQDISNFDQKDYSLHEIQVETLCGLVFVNLDPNAEPLKSRAVGLEEDLRRWIPGVDDLKAISHDAFGGDAGIRANWKVVVDNYVECYHCEKAHPAFSELNCMQDYELDTFGIWSRQLGPSTRIENTAYQFSRKDPIQQSAFWYVWPTTTINVIPGETLVSVLSIQPTSLGTTSFAGDTLAHKSEQGSQRLDWLYNILGAEDMALCESVQKGLNSRSYNQGPFVADTDKSGIGEHALHHFHCLVRDALEQFRPTSE